MNYFALSGLINLIAAVAGILIITIKNKNWQKENKFFIGLCLAVMIWSFGYLNWQMADEYISALFWIRILSIGSTLIPILYLHFILNLVLEVKKEEKAKILKLGYGFSLLFLLFAFSPLFIKEVKAADQFPFWPQPGYLYHFYLIFSYLGLVGYGLIKLFKDYRYLTSEPDYLKSLPRITQAKLIILATFIGFGGGAANFFLFYNIPIAPYTNILAGLGLLLMAWAIRKYSYFYIPFESGFDKVRRMYRQPYGYQIENFKTA